MDDITNLKTVEKVTSKILRTLDYQDYDVEIDWLKI